VIDKHSEQPEIPGMQNTTLSSSNRDSGSNALEIFHSSRYQSVFGLRNNLPGNAMVHISGEAGYPAGKLLEVAFGRSGAFALEPAFQRIESISGLVNLFSRMHFSVRIDSKILSFEYDRFVSFVGFSNLGYCPDSKLRGETKHFAYVIINHFVNLNFVGPVHLKSNSGDSVAGFIEAMHGIQKHLMLLLAGIQFDHQVLKHCTQEGVQLISSFWHLQRGTLLPGLKADVSAAPAPRRKL
jgi:hypothetical protein